MSATRRPDGKRPLTVVAGPYGHPFHPLLVTVPIGAWVASLVFDLATYVAAQPEGLLRAAWWLIAIGILGALAAAVFGVLDLLAIPRGTRAFTTALGHMGLNLVVVALYAVGLGLRWEALDQPPVTGAALTVSVVALALLGVSGWLGGKLTYTFGIRVMAERDQAAGQAK